MSDKRPLVLWSGGTDSTCLVIDLLKEGDIDVLYIDIANNVIPQRHEKKAITKLKCLILDANLPGKIISEYKFGYSTISVTKQIYAQPALWINAAAYIADTDIHSSVNLGYVRADDAWYYRTEIMNLYTAMNDLVSEGKEVPLEFPLKWDSKTMLIERLKKFVYFKQVMRLIYWCEKGTKIQCGECRSCLRHKSELGDE